MGTLVFISFVHSLMYSFSLCVIILVFFSQSQSHGGIVINEYVGYALAHKGRADDPNNVYSPADEAEAYTNPNAYEKMAEYTSHARARHGDDFDPATEPLDTEILMRAGGGKQHGRYYMAHSAIDPTTVPTLRQVRQASSTTSSDVPIRARQPSFQVTIVLCVVHILYIYT